MAKESCAGCGDPVTVGGGIAGIWSADPEPTGGMTLEFDGGEWFLCFSCIDALPEEPTRSDVEDLPGE